jgi:hypothetical protein
MNPLYSFHQLPTVMVSCMGCTAIFILSILFLGFLVELVVLRGIAQSSEQSEVLYKWASGVVEQACYDRRDVRVCSVLPIFFFLIIPFCPIAKP